MNRNLSRQKLEREGVIMLNGLKNKRLRFLSLGLGALILMGAGFGSREIRAQGTAQAGSILGGDSSTTEPDQEASDDFEIGAIYFCQEEFDSALLHLERAIAKDQEQGDAYLLHGICCIQKEMDQKAIQSFESYIALSQEDCESLNVVGKILYAHGWLKQAEDVFRRGLEREPGNAVINSNLGSVLVEMQCWEEARACFLKAIANDPELSEAQINMGLLYYLLEDYSSAEQAFLMAAKINHDAGVWDPIVFANLGDLYFTTYDLQSCIQSYFIALDIDPKLSEIRNRLGIVLRLSGDLSKAREQFELSILHGGAPPQAHANLADCLLLEGDFSAAISEFREAIQCTGSSDPEPMVALAEVFMRMERDDNALVLYRKAFTLGERSPTTLSNLSTLSERLGYDHDAVAYFHLLERAEDMNTSAQLESARRCVESRLEGIHNPEKAVIITQKLGLLTNWKHPGVLNVRASAYAAMGDFKRAVEMQSLAISALPAENPLVGPLRNRLKEYIVRDE